MVTSVSRSEEEREELLGEDGIVSIGNVGAKWRWIGETGKLGDWSGFVARKRCGLMSIVIGSSISISFVTNCTACYLCNV